MRGFEAQMHALPAHVVVMITDLPGGPERYPKPGDITASIIS